MCETREKIIAYCDGHPGASVRQIQAACGVSSPSVVHYHLKRTAENSALQAFIDACKKYEANGGDFADAFRLISIADIRRVAKIRL